MLMKKKSRLSLRAARILTKKGMGTQSIHCMYYSVFQLMKHKLATSINNPISYEEQNTASMRYGSHNSLLDKVTDRISDEQIKTEVRNTFCYLKRIRVLADYNTNILTSNECRDLLKMTEKLRCQLFNYVR